MVAFELNPDEVLTIRNALRHAVSGFQILPLRGADELLARFEAEVGQCSYCYGTGFDDLRSVQLTHSMRSGEWQEPRLVCGPCRRYLRNHFRYAMWDRNHTRLTIFFPGGKK